MVLLNTPPRVRNSRSLSKYSSAWSSEEHTVGIFASSSGGRWYRSFDAASPGWILFCTPSRPAINSAEKHRYGLDEGSGKRVSMRRPFGFGTCGMRIEAERLRDEYASFTGASKPGTRRLYELVPGLVIAFSARACLMMPPM